MDDDGPERKPTRWAALLPAWLRRFPADLALVVGLTIVTLGAVFLPVVRDTPLRVVVGFPFLLFVPGYALVAALFPESSPTDGGDAVQQGREGLTTAERVAFSFGASVAVVPLAGIALTFTRWGVRLVPVVTAVTLLTLGFVALAARRRAALDPPDRLRVPWREWLSTVRAGLFEPDSRTDAALNAFLVVSVLLAVGSVGYAVGDRGDAISEFYLLSEGPDGELAADNYPREYRAGERRSLVVGVQNLERQPVNYTVLVELHAVAIQNGTPRVLQRERLHRYRVDLTHNETWEQRHAVTPTLTGERLRLTYLLYRGAPPERPTTRNAYRELHVWVTVTG